MMPTISSPLKDRDVRAAIHRQIVPALVGDSPSKVLDEFPLCLGEARIDVAVVNGRLHGIEIKSEADTLERLNRQIEAYGKVFDTVTIVCGKNHLKAVRIVVPRWWGIYVASSTEREQVLLKQIRCARENPNVEPIAIAQFLWKHEIVALLQASGITKGIVGKSRRALWPALTAIYPLPQLQDAVRGILKNRLDWRPDLQQT